MSAQSRSPPNWLRWKRSRWSRSGRWPVVNAVAPPRSGGSAPANETNLTKKIPCQARPRPTPRLIRFAQTAGDQSGVLRDRRSRLEGMRDGTNAVSVFSPLHGSIFRLSGGSTWLVAGGRSEIARRLRSVPADGRTKLGRMSSGRGSAFCFVPGFPRVVYVYPRDHERSVCTRY